MKMFEHLIDHPESATLEELTEVMDVVSNIDLRTLNIQTSPEIEYLKDRLTALANDEYNPEELILLTKDIIGCLALKVEFLNDNYIKVKNTSLMLAEKVQRLVEQAKAIVSDDDLEHILNTFVIFDINKIVDVWWLENLYREYVTDLQSFLLVYSVYLKNGVKLDLVSKPIAKNKLTILKTRGKSVKED